MVLLGVKMGEYSHLSKAMQRKIRRNTKYPDLPFYLNTYVNAYYELCSERSPDTGLIPVTKILYYGSMLGFEPLNDFKRVMIRVDYDYVDYSKERAEKKREKEKANSKGKK